MFKLNLDFFGACTMTKNDVFCSITINDNNGCAVVCEEDDDQWVDMDDDTQNEGFSEPDRKISFSRIDPKLLLHENQSVLTTKLHLARATSLSAPLTRVDSDEDVRRTLSEEIGDQEKLSLSREKRQKGSITESSVKRGCWRMCHWKVVQIKIPTDDLVYNINDYHTKGW